MGFHYAYEKKKFDREWKQLEQEYKSAGMSEEQIALIKKHDWAWFCSQRVFQNHTQKLPCEEYEDEYEQSRLFQKFDTLSYCWDTGDIDGTRYGWLSAIENEQLYHKLCRLSKEDLELLTLIFVEGYRQTDVARIWNCSRSAITQRLNKIKAFLKKT